MTAAIGPYTFSTMEGRLEVAASGAIPTTTGIKVGPPKPVVSDIRTFETATSFLLAWQQAGYYRSAIGNITSVTDDGGILAPNVLVCDCRCRILAGTAGTGAVLETAWKLMPSLDYGTYAQANVVLDLTAYARLQQATWAVTSSTAISVGTVTFTTATGDLQWPIAEAQRSAVRDAARALSGDESAAAPSMAGGQLVTIVEAATEQACFDKMVSCRAMAGSYADINLGGILIPAVAIIDCHASWSRVVGLPSGNLYLFTCVWDCDVQEDGSGDDLRTCSLVQTASVWGAWTTVPLAVCEGADEGLNGSVGQATWTLDLGKTLRARTSTQSEPTDYTAKWVRVCSRYRGGTPGVTTTVPTGATPDPKGATLVPCWHGEVIEQGIDFGSQAVSATMSHTCAGIMACWEKVYFTRWYEVGQGFGMADPGEVLPFNALAGGDGGGVGTQDLNTGGGETAIAVHDRQRVHWDGSQYVPDLRRHTAQEIIRLIVKAVSVQFPQGPKWVLGGQVTALNFIGDWDLRKKNALQMFTEIVSPRWGLTFRPEVIGDTVTLRINTEVQAATAVPGIGTLPANDRQSAKTLTGKSIVRGTLRRSASAQADHLLMEAGRGWGMATFCYGPGATPAGKGMHLAKGWHDSQDATWAAANAQQRNSDALRDVHRRFVLKHEYDGGTFNEPNTNALLRMARKKTGLAETGINALDDGFEVGGVLPYGENLRFTRKLPFYQGTDWAELAGTGAVVDLRPTPLRQPEGPLVFGLKVTGGLFTYTDFTHKWDVQVEEDAAAITLGKDATDAAEIRNWLASGGYLLFTVGIESALPWRVSYRRAQADRPRDMERTQMLYFPEILYRQCYKGTILGLSSSTETKKAELDIRLDWEVTLGGGIGRLSAPLSLAQLWYRDLARSLNYEERGVLDVSTTTAPGSMITTATLPLDATRTMTETCNAVVSGRSWDFRVDSVGTRISTDRMLPGFDRFTMAKTVPRKALNLNKNYQLGIGLK